MPTPPEPLTVVVPVVVPVIVPVPIPPGPAVFRLDRPDEDFPLPRLSDGAHVKLVGRVKDLFVGGLEGATTLDASELETRNVIVLGTMDGGSTLLAKKVRGSVQLRRKIDGGSRVVIVAAGGVVVSDHSGKPDDAAKIVGGSRLTATAQAVTLAGTVSGKGTEIDLTLTPKAMLRFTALDDLAVLRYRTEHRADPPPRLTRGTIAGGAELREEPPP